MKGDRILLGLLVVGGIELLGSEAWAQSLIVPDGTLGSESSALPPAFQSPTLNIITGGASRGSNLFHSFRDFNVNTGNSAYFFIPDNTIRNVLTRVTGTNASEILGRLGTLQVVNNQFTSSNANFFLVNPNGVIFGPSSSLDIGGSVVVTTANALQFPNGELFSATVPTIPNSVLTIDPSVFLFNAINSQAKIINQSLFRGTTLDGRSFVGLQVPNGKNLILLGGNIRIEGGILQAPGGKIELGGLAENGSVNLAKTGEELQLQFPDSRERSDVSLITSSLSPSGINVAADGGGNIIINTRNLDILGGNTLQAGISSGLGTVNTQAGNIILNATGLIQIEGVNGIFNTVQASSKGKAGNININAESLSIKNGATLNSSTFGQGDAGNISIIVRDVATFDGVGSNGQSSGAGSQVAVGAFGKGGTLTLDVGMLNVINGATLNSSTFGQGDAGNVSITVRDTATFEGVGSNLSSSEAGSTTGPDAVGKAGTLTMNAGSLTVRDGAQLNSSTLGRGDAGNVSIVVRNATIFDGVGSNGKSSGAGSEVGSNALGKGGTLTLNANSLTVTNGAQLSSSTFGQGNAGNTFITVRDTATFDGIGNNGLSSFAGSEVGSNALGKGGMLTLNANSLTVSNGATLSSSTFGRGDSGNISITVRDMATFDGVGNNGLSSFAGTVVGTNGAGKGGTLILNAGSLTVRNGAQLSSSTFGKGDAGNISITVRDTAIFEGSGIGGTLSQAGSQVGPNAVGKGGTLILNAGSLSVRNGAVLNSSTYGKGDAGNISIIVRDTAIFEGGGIDGTSSQAGSQVGPDAVGKGGTLTLNASSLSVRNGAQLNSSTFGKGDAGNVSITVRDTATFEGSGNNGFSSFAGSTVNPSGVGNGGTLTLNVGALNVSNGAVLNSSTFGKGDAGNVFITVRGNATFEGVGKNGFPSGAASQVNPNAVGNGGTLTVNAGSLTVSNGAQLNSSTFGQGNAGGILLQVREILRVTDGTIATFSLLTAGGSIDISAKTIRLSGNSNIVTSVFNGNGGGGNITLSANSIVALDDSDILAFARDGKGGNVTLNTRAFFGQNYRPAPFGTDPATLDGNDRVDINASGSLSSGTITTPDTSFIQNSLNQLSKDAIDTTKLLSQTCLVRKDKPEGTFYIVGAGGLPNRPGDLSPAQYPTNTIQPTQTANRPWQKGDPIVEPTGFYQLANGRLVMSRECDRASDNHSSPLNQ